LTKKKKLSLSSFLKAKKLLREDEELQNRFDSNQDGNLDPDELETGAKKLGEEIEASEQIGLNESTPLPSPQRKYTKRTQNAHVEKSPVSGNVLFYGLIISMLVFGIVLVLYLATNTGTTIYVSLGDPVTFNIQKKSTCFLDVVRQERRTLAKTRNIHSGYPFLYEITDPKGENVFRSHDAGRDFRSEFPCINLGTYTLFVDNYKKGMSGLISRGSSRYHIIKIHIRE